MEQRVMKRGISLIAVLMFMLAATLASIVIFRWVSQENFRSGARLKNSESYQASQAGLESVQAWITNKGAEAGMLVTIFQSNNGNPVHLTSDGNRLLKDMRPSSSRQQNFEVYLTGVDVSKPTYKFKFLSIGTARDGSRHSQVGIFEVDGLYQVKVPRIPGKPSEVDLPGFYGMQPQSTQINFSTATITGNWTGSGGIRSTGHTIVTGDYTAASGTNIGCDGGTAPSQGQAGENPGDFYLGGNWNGPQSATLCGNAYINGNMNITGTVTVRGDLYVKGNLTLNQNITIGGNLTVEGDIIIGSASYTLNVGGNLVMPNSTSTLNTGGAGKVTVKGAAWLAGKYFQGGASEVDCPSTARFEASVIYKNSTSMGCTFQAATGTPTIAGANTVEHLREQLTLQPPYTVPPPIVLKDKENWLNQAVPTSCEARLWNPNATNTWVNANGIILLDQVRNRNATAAFIAAVNDCYANQLGKGTLYKSPYRNENSEDESLVLNINYGSQNHDELSGLILEGNFVIVVRDKPSMLVLAQTNPLNSNVVLYLMKGASNVRSTSNPTNFRYFIYSEEDIDQINGTLNLGGYLFMADGKQVKNATDIKFVEDKVLSQFLQQAGIINENESRCAGTGLEDPNNPGKCRDDKNPNDTDLHDPDNIQERQDVYHIPLTHHLKSRLQSQYINEEILDLGTSAATEQAILVVPRVIYVTKGASMSKLPNLYSVFYLNGAKKPEIENLPMCSGSFEGAGIVECYLTGKECANSSLCTSPFYVFVYGDASDPAVNLSASKNEVEEDECAQIYAIAETNDSGQECEISVGVNETQGAKWEVILSSTNPAKIPPAGNLKVYDICASSSTAGSVEVYIESTSGCQQGTDRTQTVAIKRNEIDIRRIACSTLCGNMVPCPNPGSSWLNLTCNMGVNTMGNVDNGWKCDAVSGQSAAVGPATSIPAACEAPDEGIMSSLSTNLNIKISSAVPAGGTVLFEYDLAWKKHKVTVSGGSQHVTLATTDEKVPVAERTLTCIGSTGCDVYHGVTYAVTHAGSLVNWSCNPSGACLPPDSYLNTTATDATITPTSNVLINLSTLTLGIMECTLKPGLQVVKNQPLGTLADYVENSTVAGPCGNPSFTHSASSTNTSTVGSEIKITVGLTCSTNNSNVTNGNAVCSGSIVVVDEIEPKITCDWGNGASDYYVGDIPSIKSSVTNGNAISCGVPSVKTSSLGSWGNASPNTSSTAPNITIAYTITGSAALNSSYQGEHKNNDSTAVRALCSNGEFIEKRCPNKNVEAERPCEYQASWCGGNAFASVTNNWSSTGKSNGCYFVSSIDRHDGAATIMINGQNFATTCGQWSAAACATFLTNIPKADGGYYIYQPNTLYNSGMTNGPTLKEGCVVPTATCTWAGAGQTMFTSAAKPADPVVTCSPSSTVSIASWSTGLPPATLGTATTYSPVPTGVTCGGKAIGNASSITCGTLTVKQTPSINQCTGTANQNVTLPATPTQPTVTLTDPSNVCSNSGSNVPNAGWSPTWTVSRNGTNASNATWNSLFTIAGTYNNYSISGNCGDYPNSLTSTCTGSATVTGAATCAYNPSWCNGIAFDQVVKTSQNGDQNGPRCVFATVINTMGNENGQGGGLLVNGIKLRGSGNSDVGGRCGNTGWGQRSCADALANDNVQKADGGYYIYIPSWAGDFNTTGGTPTCGGGTTPSSSSSSAPSSSSSAPSSSSVGGGGTAVCNGSGTSFGAGTHTVSVASSCTGGQFLCWGNDGIAKTVTFNGSARSGDALRYGSSTWVENWSNPNKPFTATLTVSAGIVTCMTGW